MPKRKELLKQLPKVDGEAINVFLIDPTVMVKAYPVWKEYRGCHHWGKKCDHIPQEEIWISSKGILNWENIMDHEVIEREVMKDLEERKGYTPEKAYKIGHFIAEGFESYKASDKSRLRKVFLKIALQFPEIQRGEVEKWIDAIAQRGYQLDEKTKHQLLDLISEG